MMTRQAAYPTHVPFAHDVNPHASSAMLQRQHMSNEGPYVLHCSYPLWKLRRNYLL